MKFERETIVILLLIAIVLGPMWFFALSSAEAGSPIVLSQNKGAIAPTETFLPTPTEVNEFVAGVITWIALFLLVGMIYYTHRFVRTIGRSEGSVVEDGSIVSNGSVTGDRAAADGGTALSLPSYLTSGDRWLADYWPAQYAKPGMIGMALVSWTTVVFAVLFGMEALAYSRTQFLGIYGGMLFLSLGVLVAIYTTWFLPSAVVVEDRGHEAKLTEAAGENRTNADRGGARDMEADMDD